MVESLSKWVALLGARSVASADCIVTLAYHGAAFKGFQSQGDPPAGSKPLRCVEDTFLAALREVSGDRDLTICALSRTDSGVSAKDQLCWFRIPVERLTAKNLAPEHFRGLLNAALPPDIHVGRLRLARPSQILIKFAATRKRYTYFLGVGDYRALGGTVTPHLLYVAGPLDLAKMRLAAADILGTHDFTPFSSSSSDSPSNTAVKRKREEAAVERRRSSAQLQLLTAAATDARACNDDETAAAADDGDDDDAPPQSSYKVGNYRCITAVHFDELDPAEVTFSLHSMRESENSRWEQSSSSSGVGEVLSTSAAAASAAAAGSASLSASSAACSSDALPSAVSPAASAPNKIIKISFEGDGFLRKMVRKLVGTLICIGSGKQSVSFIRDTLREADGKGSADNAPTLDDLSSSTVESPSSAAALQQKRNADAASLRLKVAGRAVAGRALWLDKTFVPEALWEDDDWCNNKSESYRADWKLPSRNAVAVAPGAAAVAIPAVSTSD